MSNVTNLLICGIYAKHNLEKINTWLNDINPHIGFRVGYWFKDIDMCAGGDKFMDTDILGCALNYFDRHVELFVNFLKTLDWAYKTDLFIQKDQEEIFTRIKLNY